MHVLAIGFYRGKQNIPGKYLNAPYRYPEARQKIYGCKSDRRDTDAAIAVGFTVKFRYLISNRELLQTTANKVTVCAVLDHAYVHHAPAASEQHRLGRVSLVQSGAFDTKAC